MSKRHCPLFYCTNVKKNGFKNGRQRYLCHDCQACWTSPTRAMRFRNKLWRQYTFEGRSVAWLAIEHHKNPKFIHQQLNLYEVGDALPRTRNVTVIMDATYFGSWGVSVVIDPDAKTGKAENLVLYWAVIEGTEKTADYEAAIDEMVATGYVIDAAVIDGRRGVRQMLERKDIPVQQCQFHQLQTITQCLTRNPKLQPNKELRDIALSLTRTTQAGLTAALDLWYEEYGEWLKERDETSKQYVHRRTRRAYFSLGRNLPYLFTYQDKALAAKGIKIRNTTNALDGRFGVWKIKLKQHRGCSKERTIKILRSLLSRTTD